MVCRRASNARRFAVPSVIVRTIAAGGLLAAGASGCAGGGATLPGPSVGTHALPPRAAADNHGAIGLPSGVHFVTAFGGTGERIGQFRAPEAIAVDLQGNVFVAERLNNRVQKFDRNGQYILQFGSHFIADGFHEALKLCGNR